MEGARDGGIHGNLGLLVRESIHLHNADIVDALRRKIEQVITQTQSIDGDNSTL